MMLFYLGLSKGWKEEEAELPMRAGPTGRWVLSKVFLPVRVLPMGAHGESMSRNVLVLPLSS